ncbi:hypothetical protein [Streptomyces oceani]|uniref:PknH-like extracellular domain-containing protein n=1 Tax=Streptomyces oceani TaxID=1075402 RepID=A0A1E7KQ46_9ACTN|nr:hypothetical protein [Streptomyces oceani]OEV06037.1 hypothetical protein AN216_00770 [Streptomyces oceani]
MPPVRRARTRVPATTAVALATGLLISSCSTSEDSPSSGPSSGPGGDSTPAPSATPTGPDFTPERSRVPRTPAQARELVREVTATPRRWGPGYVKQRPYESDPSTLGVLDEECRWQREELPSSVLATLSRSSELPAADGKGPVRVAATVTVHRAETDADWAMARIVEDALRCPEQRLSATETVTGLLTVPLTHGAFNKNAEDSVVEQGQFVSDELGGPHYYTWMRSRLGRINVTVVGKGSEGRKPEAVDKATNEGMAAMLVDLETELEAS